MRRLDSRHSTGLFALLMSVSLSFFISLFLVAVKTGFGEGFLLLWTESFFLGVIVGFPISLLVIPIVRKIVDSLTW